MKFKILLLDWQGLISVLLVVLAGPQFGISPLVFICLVPWLLQVRKNQNVKSAFIQGLWMSLIYSLLALQWMILVFHNFLGYGWGLSALLLILFSVLSQPQFILLGPLFLNIKRICGLKTLNQWPIFDCLLLSFLYVALEWALPKVFRDSIGLCFYNLPRMRQIADLGSVSLLTFLSVWTCSTLTEIIRTRRLLSWPLWAAIVPLLLTLSYGEYRNREIENLLKNSQSSVRIAGIQPNIKKTNQIPSEKERIKSILEAFNKYYFLSNLAKEDPHKPEAIIWPEAAYPWAFGKPRYPDQQKFDDVLRKWVKTSGLPIFFGGLDRNQSEQWLNSIFLLQPKGEDLDLSYYHQQILIPIGEYLPGAKTFQILRKVFPQISDYGREDNGRILELRRQEGETNQRILRIMPIICYEDLFPNYFLSGVREKVDFILNVANDSWFGFLAEPEYHLATSVFRSIEMRLTQFRVTTTGISALILPNGEITQKTKTDEETVISVNIPLGVEMKPTLVQHLGDWVGPFTAMFSVLLTGVGFVSRMKALK